MVEFEAPTITAHGQPRVMTCVAKGDSPWHSDRRVDTFARVGAHSQSLAPSRAVGRAARKAGPMAGRSHCTFSFDRSHERPHRCRVEKVPKRFADDVEGQYDHEDR